MFIGRKEYDFIDPRKHLAHNLPNGYLPKFPKVLAEHLPVILHKDIYIQLKQVEKSMSDYEYFVSIVKKLCSSYFLM